ncbi:MAG: hypothetical protein JSV80_01700 [Acidobacteriota bacterium]|nr:MAG: hypothetical protein JSV80_01700 [Acidobacteriota bacterium]
MPPLTLELVNKPGDTREALMQPPVAMQAIHRALGVAVAALECAKLALDTPRLSECKPLEREVEPIRVNGEQAESIEGASLPVPAVVNVPYGSPVRALGGVIEFVGKLDRMLAHRNVPMSLARPHERGEAEDGECKDERLLHGSPPFSVRLLSDH